MFQGNKTLKELNYGQFPFDPAEIDFVLLTHAHIDHSGLVPKLWKHGFTGRVYTTPATRDLLTFMLPDSGYIQETEVRRLNQRNRRRGRGTVQPIYTRQDAEECMHQFTDVAFDTWVEAVPGIRARFWNAGHILGAASLEVEVNGGSGNADPLRLLFSGDIGPQEKTFHEDPEAPVGMDCIIVEGTYGDRDRDDISLERRRAVLKQELMAVVKAGGNIIIPAFAVERTQELLYDIGLLISENQIPNLRVYLDSPLAIRATEVFERYAAALEGVDRHKGLFRHRNFHFLNSAEESMALVQVSSGAIIVAASGMCEAGRIRHHLKNNLWRPQATVLFVGYQAPGTLGNLLLAGEKMVRIQGDEVAVRARIRKIDTYSAHSDQQELVDWACARLPVSRGLFLTHGEENALSTLRAHLISRGCPPEKIHLPRLDETFDLVAQGPLEHKIERPRVAQEEVIGTDWHNEYAAFLVGLGDALRQLPDNAERRRVLKRLQSALEV